VGNGEYYYITSNFVIYRAPLLSGQLNKTGYNRLSI